MSSKLTKEQKILKDSEKIYREIARNPRDIVSIRQFMLKKKKIQSGKKFDDAFELLKNEGKILVKKGYALANPKDIKMGRVFISDKGSYVTIEGHNGRYYLTASEVKNYKTNQRVSVAITDDGFSRRPFIVSAVNESEDNIYHDMEKKEDLILGRVVKVSHDELAFIPNSKKFTKNIKITNDKSKLASFQDKICKLRLIADETSNSQAYGQIEEIVGDAGNPIQEYEAIAANQGAIMSWRGTKLEEEISQIPETVDLTGKTLIDEKGELIVEGDENLITDLRHLAFTTVDPATCKDMDDAIYSTFDEKGNLVVYTAVANVTKYVDINSEIGKQYIQGGFTVYAPNRAYNILPPQLSTGICSLNPQVDRLALVIRTVIDSNGKPIENKFMDAVINSHGKYSYEEAQKIFDESSLKYEDLKQKSELTLDEQIVLNKYAADMLWKGFNERDLINFETHDEYDCVFNEDYSDILDIVPQENCDYHKVIEAFMLTANEAAADFTHKHKIPSIYRIHEQPSDERQERAYEFFNMLGIPFEGDMSPIGIKGLIDHVRGTKKEKVVNDFLVRMQNKAKYANTHFVHENVGKRFDKKDKLEIEEGNTISHFGLQSEAYSHTTSPIRRITDYVTHYNILATINHRKPLNEKTALEIAHWANERQDAVSLAEEEFQEVNSAIYCEGHKGQVLKGTVSRFKQRINDMGQKYLAVILVNEDKGIKVEIPASQLLSKREDKFKMSKYGSAICAKDGFKPLIKLCDEVSFKIVDANRKSRVIQATTEIEKQMSWGGDLSPTPENEIPHLGKPVNSKKQQIIERKEYEKNHTKQKRSEDKKASIKYKRTLQKIKEGSIDDMLNEI